MIVAIKKAVLHILDSTNRMPMLSEKELDISDGMINTFITRHVEKVYDDASHRNGEFMSNSGFKYHINEYREKRTDLIELSRIIAERFFDGLCASEDAGTCDIIVCDLTIDERDVIGILKLNNKIGFTHQVIKNEEGIFNNLINHYAILPNMSQKLSEYAFIDVENLTIRYRSAVYKTDGEKTDMFADVLLECEYEISSREAVNTVTKAAKRVTQENGGDIMETAAKIKECVIGNIEEKKDIDTTEIANHIFDGRPVMKEEFNSKMDQSSVPRRIEVNKYVAKKVTSDIKITTDIGIELSFPAEYYRDNKYVDIINNEDGTISIQINNIGEIINK